MTEVENPYKIQRRWRREGRTHRTEDVITEWKRQCREDLREREDAILAAAERPDASDHQRAVAEQIREHRAAGNYTTQG